MILAFRRRRHRRLFVERERGGEKKRKGGRSSASPPLVFSSSFRFFALLRVVKVFVVVLFSSFVESIITAFLLLFGRFKDVKRRGHTQQQRETFSIINPPFFPTLEQFKKQV